MTTIHEFMQQPWVFALGWAILHSLWQCALIAGGCALVLFSTRQYSANFRYFIALVAMLCCALASAVTFYRYMSLSSELAPLALDGALQTTNALHPAVFDPIALLNRYINTLVLLWILGFSGYTLKTLLAYRYCQQLKRAQLIATPERWQHIFSNLCQQVGITKSVELRFSELVSFPCVIGHLKPVVLMPAGLLLRMNQLQIEAILLHELGHVRRNDYVLSLMQAICKTLLFFNPFFLWISSQMDKEREHACDDIAVSVNQDPLLFANTLKEFADMNNNLKPALGIQGDKLLLNRITRLFAKPHKTASVKSTFLAMFLIIATGGVVSVCVNAQGGSEPATQVSEAASDKLVTLEMNNKPLADVMAEVNKQCGTAAAVEQDVQGELVSLRFEAESCDKVIPLIQSFR